MSLPAIRFETYQLRRFTLHVDAVSLRYSQRSRNLIFPKLRAPMGRQRKATRMKEIAHPGLPQAVAYF
jgi:hypothetical protein